MSDVQQKLRAGPGSMWTYDEQNPIASTVKLITRTQGRLVPLEVFRPERDMRWLEWMAAFGAGFAVGLIAMAIMVWMTV